MNKVIMMGRLTKDPEVRYGGANNTAVASYSIAVDRRIKRKGQPTADFFNCKSFGKQGEFVEKYISKGMKVALEGRWQTGSYEKNGAKYYTNDCIVERFDFADSKKDGSPAPEPQTDADGFMHFEDGIDEDVPFN